MKKIIKYEEINFNSDFNNWPDFRNTETYKKNDLRLYPKFWCHGSPGILLGRKHILKKHSQREKDIIKGISIDIKSLKSPINDEISLCHGKTGNTYINILSKKNKIDLPTKNMLDDTKISLYNLLKNSNKTDLIPNINLSLMNGISGFGFALLHSDNHINYSPLEMDLFND